MGGFQVRVPLLTIRAFSIRLSLRTSTSSARARGGFAVRRGTCKIEEDVASDRRVAQRLVLYLLIHCGSAIPRLHPRLAQADTP